MTARNLRLFKFIFALLRMNPRHLLQRAPLLLGALILAPAIVFAAGNERIQSFSQAKKILEREIYADHRVTLYCGAKFDERKRVELPAGFMTPKHAARAERVEWEHVVPAENFGRAFPEWREGAPACVDSRGRAYKGRRCAEKASAEFRRMESDLYNLYPAIGAVNAMRSNYRYALLPDVPPTFGSCAMKVARRRAEPPEEARGTIARSQRARPQTLRIVERGLSPGRLGVPARRAHTPRAGERQRFCARSVPARRFRPLSGPVTVPYAPTRRFCA